MVWRSIRLTGGNILMPTRSNKNFKLLFLSLGASWILAGCAQFAGIRTPLYDGEPIVYDEEAATIYENHKEITGDEKEYYVRHDFSPDLWTPSLEFSGESTILLEQGTYEIGKDLPAGRAVLHGEDSDFAPNMRIIHVGTVTITDENESKYFETLFNDASGIKDAVVDLREGHTIEVVGDSPEITVTYVQSDDLSSENQLIAGLYEVGEHIEPGDYSITNIAAPRTTELYWFQEGKEPRVIELLATGYTMTEEELDSEWEKGNINETEYNLQLDEIKKKADTQPTIELESGDKLYLPMIYSLKLVETE